MIIIHTIFLYTVTVYITGTKHNAELDTIVQIIKPKKLSTSESGERLVSVIIIIVYVHTMFSDYRR